MPFQLAEIKALFEAEDQNHWMRSDDLQNSPGFVTIVSYLIGETPSLQSIPQANENYQLSLFISLLQSPAFPSEKDKLVLDVLFHPDLFQYIRHYIFHWFTQYLMENDDEKTIQAVLALFQKVGFNTASFHEVILYNLQNFPCAANLFERNTSALKQFLLQHLPSGLVGRRHQHSFFVHGDWNYYYFLLLEEAQPHLVNDYLLQALFMGRQDLVVTLATHKNGVYKGNIIQWIGLPPTSQAELNAKFQTVLFLFESNHCQYQQLAVDASLQFLQRYTAFAEPSHWEPGCHLQSTPDLPKGHLCYRAWAVHFLLTAEKEQAKEMVFGWFSNKVFVHFDVLFVVHHHLKDESLPYLQMALEKNTAGGADYFRKIIDLLTSNFIPGQYMPTLWKLTTAKSKPVREMVARILVEKDNDAEEKAISLLGNKSADGRGTGAYILSFFSSEKAASAVRELLTTETNDNTRDLYLQIIKDGLPQHTDESIRKALVDSAMQRNKIGKPVEPWLLEEELPALHYVPGNQLSNEEVRFLLYRMSRVKGMRSDIEAKYILDAINRETSAAFALLLLKRYTDKGTKPEHKYLMALAALLGNDDVVDKIRVSTNRWIDEGRVKMAEYGVGALALQGSNTALRWVEWYSRKYKTKKANVGTAALQALEDAAEELAITVHELGDRVVPDFGFDGLFKTFVIGDDEYRAFIDSNFKLCFFNEDGKKLKALPAAANASIKEEFKAIGKEVRDIVRSQSSRMEYYLLTQRKWNVKSWRTFFLNNPVMFNYATKMLWGMYGEEGKLQMSFICREDTSLIDLNDDEIELEEDRQIGIVHPLHLQEDQRQGWKRKFFDSTIEPIFPQLERSVYVPSPERGEKKIIHDYVGKATESGMIKATLERAGWRKSDSSDGGYIDSFSLRSEHEGIQAVLEVEGVFVGGFGWDHEPKLGRLYFIDEKKNKERWFRFPKDETDERLIAIKDVPPIFYSEVLHNITSIKLNKENLEVDTSLSLGS